MLFGIIISSYGNGKEIHRIFPALCAIVRLSWQCACINHRGMARCLVYGDRTNSSDRAFRPCRLGSRKSPLCLHFCNEMKQFLSYLLALLVGAACGVLVWVCFKATPPPAPIVQVDTLIVHDTTTIVKPQYIVKRVVDTLTIPIIVKEQDTLFVPLPIEEKVYEDSTYYAVVSGFLPALDTISVFPKTIIITQTETQQVKVKPKFSFGIQGGIGIMYNGSLHAGPYIGVGAEYNF